MRPYNIEIFDTDFNLVQHYNLGSLLYEYDYLTTIENSVLLPYNAGVKKGDYIHIKNDVSNYFGYISALAVNDKYTGWTTVKFKPFISLFDFKILFDTSLQGSATSLEDAIGGIITSYWINNSDSVQNINGLAVESISTTNNWGFHITATTEGTQRAVINFMDSIIRRAMTKYQVGLYISPDFQNHRIVVKIGVINYTTFNVEADLPNVIKRNVVINESTLDTNKLIIYNQETFSESATYYLHTDGTFDMNNTDRIEPVYFNIVSGTPTQGQTFAQMAQSLAAENFDTDSYNNLIEIEVANDDNLVKPDTLRIGQIVNVVSQGVSYGSIFTGMKRDSTTTLTFGTIRLDLTKILKGAKK